MSKEAIGLLEKAKDNIGNLEGNSVIMNEIVRNIDQVLILLKQQPKALDFAVNCGAMGKGDDSCPGCIYWSDDGKLICNECGTEFYLVER